MSGMRKKQIIGKERLLFTNKALAALILPLIVEQFLACPGGNGGFGDGKRALVRLRYQAYHW